MMPTLPAETRVGDARIDVPGYGSAVKRDAAWYVGGKGYGSMRLAVEAMMR